MKPALLCVSRYFRPFAVSEKGASSIEFVLWVPLLVGLMVLITNATMILHTQTLMYDAARDSSRAVATGSLSLTAASAAMAGRFPERMVPQTRIEIVDGFVTSHISASYSGVNFIGSKLLSALTLSASVTMLVESNDEA